MLRKLPWFWLTVVITLGLAVVAARVPIFSLWGINTLAFLPSWWYFLTLGLLAVVVVLAIWRRLENSLTVGLTRLADFFWGDHRIFQIALSLLAGFVFWSFRTHPHFLGDGYTIRSNYGLPGQFVGSPTAPLATLAARGLQSLFGAFDRAGVQASFQILSALAGVVCVCTFAEIARNLADDSRQRTMIAATLILSGSLLLFFGYIEYYPLLWAASSICVWLSLRYLRTRRGFWLALLAYPVAAVVHIDGLILLPGAVILTSDRYFGGVLTSIRRRWWTMLALVVVLFVLLVTLGRQWDIVLGRFTLPWFTPEGAGTAVFAPAHLRDVGNLLLLIIPGGLLLLVWALNSVNSPNHRSAIEYLAVLSLGGAAFFLVANPDLGMARDWDLFSLSVFPLALLLSATAARSLGEVRLHELFAYVGITGILAISFVTASIAVTPSENRYESLLELYGAQNRGGWVILQNYFENKGDTDRAADVTREMQRFFPPNGAIERGYRLLGERKYAEVLSLGQRELAANRMNGEALFLIGMAYLRLNLPDSAVIYLGTAVRLAPNDSQAKNTLGQALVKAGRIDEALEVFRDAKRLNPSLTAIDEGIALAYITDGDFVSATAVADSILHGDSHAPGGHLIKLVIAVRSGQMEMAKEHFQEFVRYGSRRSDYQSIIESYEPMFR